MKALVAGATGKIGMRLVRRLIERGHGVRGMARKNEQLEGMGAEPFNLDLENDPDEKVADAVRGCDAIIFTAGAGPGSGNARKETMDYGGAVKLIEAAEKENVRRYVIVSSMGYADPGGRGDMEQYLLAKLKADVAVQTSDLEYTVIRPGRLTDDDEAGNIDAAPQLGRYGEIPREAVAAAIVEVLELENTKRRAIEILSGEKPIRDALAGV